MHHKQLEDCVCADVTSGDLEGEDDAERDELGAGFFREAHLQQPTHAADEGHRAETIFEGLVSRVVLGPAITSSQSISEKKVQS